MQELPASSHGKPVDVFADAAALEIELRRAVKGEVRFDRGSRAMYAVDGSNYRQIPIGLVIPKDKEDVIAAVAACRKFDAPILARGGGTSLAGQCCNVAVVLDFSKYMHALLELNPEKGYARVQPGIVLEADGRSGACSRDRRWRTQGPALRRAKAIGRPIRRPCTAKIPGHPAQSLRL